LNVAAAIRERDVSQLPGKRDEDWRWTDLRGLIREAPAPSAELEGDPGAGPFETYPERSVILGNGLGARPISVEAGEARVIALQVVSKGDGGHAARVDVQVASGGRLTLLESYQGQGSYLVHTELSIAVAEGGSLERVVLAEDDAEGVSVSQAEVRLSPGARFAQTVVTSGARRQRIETSVTHPGGHADLRIDGIYLLADKRHADLTSAVTHAAVDGTTQQLTKGVVRDQARAVFQGRIVVAEGADRTDARMGHHALILSDRAEVDAKPELEIYADDVSCAHGNTVGALDEDALFYARQRGIPEPEAKALLTEAFIGEVIDRIEHEGAREIVRAWAAQRLRV
jgi:Fe-S cluster assembly protein SufD